MHNWRSKLVPYTQWDSLFLLFKKGTTGHTPVLLININLIFYLDISHCSWIFCKQCLSLIIYFAVLLIFFFFLTKFICETLSWVLLWYKLLFKDESMYQDTFQNWKRQCYFHRCKPTHRECGVWGSHLFRVRKAVTVYRMQNETRVVSS